jgi:hypothetical protein
MVLGLNLSITGRSFFPIFQKFSVAKEKEKKNIVAHITRQQ